MVRKKNPAELQRYKANTSDNEASFLDVHLFSFLMKLFLPVLMINVAILILKLTISHFKILMFLDLHPIESISLNSFVLLEYLDMLLTSTLTIKC